MAVCDSAHETLTIYPPVTGVHTSRVADVLTNLCADAQDNDPPRLAQVRAVISRHNVMMNDKNCATHGADARH
jgi:hypothetical protein